MRALSLLPRLGAIAAALLGITCAAQRSIVVAGRKYSVAPERVEYFSAASRTPASDETCEGFRSIVAQAEGGQLTTVGDEEDLYRLLRDSACAELDRRARLVEQDVHPDPEDAPARCRTDLIALADGTDVGLLGLLRASDARRIQLRAVALLSASLAACSDEEVAGIQAAFRNSEEQSSDATKLLAAVEARLAAAESRRAEAAATRRARAEQARAAAADARMNTTEYWVPELINGAQEVVLALHAAMDAEKGGYKVLAKDRLWPGVRSREEQLCSTLRTMRDRLTPEQLQSAVDDAAKQFSYGHGDLEGASLRALLIEYLGRVDGKCSMW